MIMARNEDGTYSQVGFVKDNVGIDTEYIYDKDGDIVFEKGFTRETSGTVPLTINGIGKDLKSWNITGNTVQNGTPTPENPVEVQAVGERTANLFDKNTITAGNFATVSGTTANKAYYCSDFIPITATTYYFQNAVGRNYQNSVVVYDANKQGLRYEKLSGGNKASGAIAFQSGDAYIRINCYYQTDVDTVMVNIGSTALSYEPYGYKIPVVTSADGTEPVTTPIYPPTPLYSGEVMRSDGSREVKFHKLVLTGSEDWCLQSINSYGIANFYIKVDTTFKPGIKHFCTHFSIQTTLIAQTTKEGLLFTNNDTIYIRVKQELANTVSSLKSWLTEQYTAGTPVTIWYTLETPTTETITAPQIPTINGTTVIDIDTAVKPTEMYTKYKSSK